jgi:chemotaxis protein MotB
VKAGDEDTNAHELVLIRRRAASEEGGHHGGVWKIAYADFMTAMMAFFLVMWLINSTDQRVLTQVANYFNPMRLTDSTPHSRGLNTVESGEQGKQGKQSSVGDPKDTHKGKEKAQDKSEANPPAPKSDAKEDASTTNSARYTEQALFNDPYGVLARIAAEGPTDAAPAASKEPRNASDVFRDPFDPSAQHAAPDKRSAKTKPKGSSAKDSVTGPPGGEAKTERDTDVTPKVVQGPDTQKLAPAAGGEAKTPRDQAVAPRETATAADKANEQAIQEAVKAAKQAEAQKAEAQKAEAQKTLSDEAAKIESDIRRAASQLQGSIPNINVTVAEDGILISLTDDYDFGMFAIASAEPRPAMVVIMEKIAKVVQSYPEHLIVRGHTDGRPYRSGAYDNWRLSTARAHMAYYMLVRGGVDEKRFERVEGYADRNLRVSSDPDAAQNRRIEILLRRPRQ